MNLKILRLVILGMLVVTNSYSQNDGGKHSPQKLKQNTAPPTQTATFVTGVGPNLNSALKALMPLAKTPLKELKYCAGVVNDARVKEPTVVDYFTDLVDAFRDKNSRNFVQWNCRVPAEIERAPKGSFNCDLLFNSRDPNGESPFSYGFRLYYRNGRMPGKDSIECIGAG